MALWVGWRMGGLLCVGCGAGVAWGVVWGWCWCGCVGGCGGGGAGGGGWLRCAGAVASMLAGMFDFTESLQQLYLDDLLLVVAGTAEQRRYLIAMYFLTVRMLGISMAWHKTARGLELVWIGVLFRLDLENGLVVVTLPEKTVTLLRNEAAAMKSQAVVGVNRLRTFVGKLCWVSGILPRVRWIVGILYAVLTKHEREVKSRTRRQTKRRTPEHMIHTKRMALALTWVAAFWNANSATLTRIYTVREVDADLGITTDASLWGVGVILVHTVISKVMAAVEATLAQEDADELGVVIEDQDGQGVLALLGNFFALQCWIHQF